MVRLRFADAPAVLVREYGHERKAAWWVLAHNDDGPLERLGPEPDYSEEFAEIILRGVDGRRVRTLLHDERTVYSERHALRPDRRDIDRPHGGYGDPSGYGKVVDSEDALSTRQGPHGVLGDPPVVQRGGYGDPSDVAGTPNANMGTGERVGLGDRERGCAEARSARLEATTSSSERSQARASRWCVPRSR